MKEKTDKLHEAYIKKFSELKECERVMTAGAYTAMTDNLLKEYNREYALMDGEEGIATDTHIEDLKTRYDGELEAKKFSHYKQTSELRLQSDKLKYEAELQRRIAEAKAELLSSELVPADLPKRWWQRRARPNYAKKLMLRELSFEIDDYFAARLSEIERLEGKAADITELLYSTLPRPRGRRAGRKYDRTIQELAARLELMLSTAAAAVQADPDMNEVYDQPEPAEKPGPARRSKAESGQLAGQMKMDLPDGR